MKVKTSELTDAALDWAVAEAIGAAVVDEQDGYGLYCYFDETEHLLGHCPLSDFNPSTNWSQGGPIIERERIQVFPHNGADDWAGVAKAQRDGYVALIVNDGPTPLIAAMRCYVASKLGDEVEVPDELC